MSASKGASVVKLVKALAKHVRNMISNCSHSHCTADILDEPPYFTLENNNNIEKLWNHSNVDEQQYLRVCMVELDLY